jgi:hypothetical protein
LPCDISHLVSLRIRDEHIDSARIRQDPCNHRLDGLWPVTSSTLDFQRDAADSSIPATQVSAVFCLSQPGTLNPGLRPAGLHDQ